jgi:DNA (cytosine-5)-methyltransferase 1
MKTLELAQDAPASFAAAGGCIAPVQIAPSAATGMERAAEWAEFQKQPNTLYELHLFAGAGGGILGGLLCGHRPCCAVEIEPFARRVLMQRQRDGALPWFPVWDDVRTFDGRPWRGIADVVCGGFPCQDISASGEGAGIDGERSGLWGEMARVVREVEPRFVFVENSPMLTSRGLGRVLGDLAEMGFDAEWGVCGADAAGLPHHRSRLWLVAYAYENERSEQPERQGSIRLPRGMVAGEMGGWIPEPALLGENHGVADLVDRCAAIGNGQVPSVAAFAWRLLVGRAAGAGVGLETSPTEKQYNHRICEE